jgi:hypothetical protein
MELKNRIKDIMNAILTDGGITLNPSDFTEYKADAWAVGCGASHEHYHRIVDGAGDKFTDALNKVATWAGVLNEPYSVHAVKYGEPYKVGAWIDDHKPGVIVLEVSEVVTSTQDAIIKAVKRCQSSIYHLGSGEYVSLNAIIKAVQNA